MQNNNTPPLQDSGIINDEVNKETTVNNVPNDTLPDNPDELRKMLEIELKRRKDTQKAFTQSQQRLKVLEKENNELSVKLSNSVVVTSEQAAELDKLKWSDPDAWFAKKLEFETIAKSAVIKEQEQIRAKAHMELTQEEKQQVIAQFLTSNPSITLDMINLDVPQRIHSKYEKGDLTVEEFVEEAKKYLLVSGKKLAEPNHNDIKDLNKVPGGRTPDEAMLAKARGNKPQLEIY